MNPLLELLDHGQSYWLDNLTRGMIRDGSLERRVEKEGLRGVTSNPSIFHKAISGGSEYDEEIERLVQEGASVSIVYERLVVSDIRDACDVLRPVWEDSDGGDGYVSLEVSPYLAHDTEGSLEEARRLYRAVDRPNVFIKIPGTPAGVPAIEEALFEGININITLLFSIESYEAVAEAYLRALERRAEAGEKVDDVASVASFFLSRIDVLTDRLLGHRLRPEAAADADSIRSPEAAPGALFGRAAIANARLAYRSFRRILESDRWERLAAAGARPQRMLWASTSTKDPLYHDVRYVEPLIGAHTVNTMPDATIDAFADHGQVADTVEEDIEGARETMARLADAGIDFGVVTTRLQDEGVQKFIDPFDRLISTLAERREEILGDRLASQEIRPGALEGEFGEALNSLGQRRFARRLFRRDPTLWTDDPEEAGSIRRRLGWLESPGAFRDELRQIGSFAGEAREDGIAHVVLLGMGGSSLCAEVCRRVFGPGDGWPDLIVLDDTDPAAVRAVENRVDLSRTLFVVASKSGTTAETMSFYRHFLERVRTEKGDDAAGHFVAITDPDTPLAREADDRGFRRVFENPADIGGRYSALSFFGLVPMALLGMDLEELLERAIIMEKTSDPLLPAEANPAVRLGALLGLAARRGRDKVTLLLPESLEPFGLWAEQLLAESTGKEGRGLVPVVGEPEAGGRYGDDRVFVSIGTTGEERSPGNRLESLAAAGHPVVRIELDDPLALGGEFFRWEVATAAAGAILGVNPFDEPNVAESKENTRRILESAEAGEDLRKAGEETAAPGGPGRAPADGERIRDFLAGARAGDYVALLPYFRETPRRRALLSALRGRLRTELALAVTLGYGPRYLHSTGQLHKGGPDTGVFVLLTADPEEEISIPGEAHGFAELHRAQALGDLRSLTGKGRRVLRMHLGGDIEGGLERLAESSRPVAAASAGPAGAPTAADPKPARQT